MSEKVFDGGLVPGSPVALGIDQSLTGFALAAVNTDKPEQYEIWVYKSDRSGVERLLDIKEWIESKLVFLEENGNLPVNAAMEGTVLASHSALKLGELAALVKITLYEMMIAENPDVAVPLQIPPMTLKKYATGKGNAKKQEMMLQIYKRWDVELNDDNAADAYALARLASGSATTEVEKSVVEQIKDPKYRDQISF